jgi:hypothetical protein
MSATTTPLANSTSAQVDEKVIKNDVSSDVVSTSNNSNGDESNRLVPLSFKLLSVLLVSAIGFGSSWSSGITGAMKTTIKKVPKSSR